MNHPETSSNYSRGERIANSLTHGFGAILALVGLAVLTVLASLRGDAWHIVSVSIYGATLVILYTASTLYHSLRWPRIAGALLHLDHSAIFLLIAGSYTPFMLVNLRGPWGWSILGVVWGLAIAGIIGQWTLTKWRRWSLICLSLYVAMGWTVVVATGPVLSAIAPAGLALVVLGGLAYTAGIAFYRWRSLKYHHAIWHVFVLAGSTLHFFAVLFYVLPPAVA